VDKGAESTLWARRVSGREYFRACRILGEAPPLLRAALYARYCDLSEPVRRFYLSDRRMQDTWNDAIGDLRRTAGCLKRARVRTAFDDDEIEQAARRASHICMGARTLEGARAFAEAQGIKLPHGPRVTQKSLRKRLVCADWWRGRLRRLMTRHAEELFRELGFVRRQSDAYISGDALERIRLAQFKGRQWLQKMLAVCQDTGEALPLQTIAEHSLSNPAIRRGELMLRARGFQEVAESQAHRCLMVTLTTPSAFHAWLKDSGERNPKYNGSTPRQAQAWLTRHWARVRARLKKRRVTYYGFRCAEPHHDGTPHWHMILYAPRSELWRIRVIIRKVWLSDQGREPGALRRRVVFRGEDPSKGSGCAYIAKYVAKNIDGAGVIGNEISDESGQRVSDDCERVTAWARLHGIRQFQQLGGPCVGLWRELRRVRQPCDCPPLEALRLAAEGTEDTGPSWSRLIEHLGGIAESVQASRSLLDHAEPRCIDRSGRNILRLTRWSELPAPIVIGLRIVWRDRIRRLATRVHIWVLIFCSELGPVAITVADYGSPTTWTNPQETSQAPPTD
jgi:hypothetical protein